MGLSYCSLTGAAPGQPPVLQILVKALQGVFTFVLSLFAADA